MPDSVFRDLLFEQLATRVGVSANKLDNMNSAAATPPAQKAETLNRSRQTSLSGTRDAVALLLQYPELAEACAINDQFSRQAQQ